MKDKLISMIIEFKKFILFFLDSIDSKFKYLFTI